MKRFTSKTQKIGEFGEEICIKWLINNKFSIIERNFTLKEGEIDIIALKEENYHFIEVKSVSYATTDYIKNNNNIYNPLENVTREKIKKCYTVIYKYLALHKIKNSFQFDVYGIYIDKRSLRHKIERIENVF